ANAVENLTRTEAARESERLRSALLDSVTHEFRTPLTSIKASVTTLLSGAALDAEQRQDLLTVIEEESDRLNRLVGEAVEMAQLDAKKVKLDLAPHQIREAIDAALADSWQALDGHPLEIRLPDYLPPVVMDVVWIKKVLQHLHDYWRSEEHTSELQSPCNIVCRLLLEKKKINARRCATLQR